MDLMRCGFEVLVEAGYEPENAYFECIHELKLIVDLINKGGVAAMNYSIPTPPSTASTSPAPGSSPPEETKARMRAVLSDIRTALSPASGSPRTRTAAAFNSKRQNLKKHQMEMVGDELRRNMIWAVIKI